MHGLPLVRHALPGSGDRGYEYLKELSLTVQFMQGNEAVAWGALAAGCRFYAGYPITPSTEIAELLSRSFQGRR
jgi:TPP-dependent indolepyruvate ferredoxin oxidoreductase alpha subunit